MILDEQMAFAYEWEKLRRSVLNRGLHLRLDTETGISIRNKDSVMVKKTMVNGHVSAEDLRAASEALFFADAVANARTT